MSAYIFETDGDGIERHYWEKFIKGEFPSYAAFWERYVVPLTNRPKNLHSKTDTELCSIGKSNKDLNIAHLHYTLLRHLCYIYEVGRRSLIDLDMLTCGMARIVGAQDVAFELLERFSNPIYGAWDERQAKNAKRTWQEKEKRPLQDIRDYRNHMLHGLLLPSLVGKKINLPKIGRENKYLDWRLITDPINNPGLDTYDLVPADEILKEAWDKTLSYFEKKWKEILLK